MSLYAIAKSCFDSFHRFQARHVRRHAALLGLLVATILAMDTSRPAMAHQASLTHSTIDIGRDQTELTYRIKFTPQDLSEVLGLGVDVEPSDQAVRAGQDRLLDFVLDHIHVQNRDQACPVERLGANIVEHGGRFIEVAYRVRCPEPFTILVIEYDLFFSLDPLHRGLVQVRYRDQRAVAELKAGASRFVWELDEPPPGNRVAFIASGVEHILYGFDHIAFLLGLLLVATLWHGPSAWYRRSLGQSFRYTASIVTSFTVAHSITLIAASLDWITLDTRLVESVIAASIVYVAVEDIVKPDPRYRAAITFTFGMIHGLGFASMLKVLLPPEDVVWPLLMFNLGVEFGQLAIVVAVLPLLHIITRALGPDRYRALFIPLAAGLLALAGLIWFVERVFDTVLIGF